MDKALELKLKVVASRHRQFELAQHMGIDQASFSRILNGIQSMPDTFEADLIQAMSAVSEEKSRLFSGSAGVAA